MWTGRTSAHHRVGSDGAPGRARGTGDGQELISVLSPMPGEYSITRIATHRASESRDQPAMAPVTRRPGSSAALALAMVPGRIQKLISWTGRSSPAGGTPQRATGGRQSPTASPLMKRRCSRANAVTRRSEATQSIGSPCTRRWSSTPRSWQPPETGSSPRSPGQCAGIGSGSSSGGEGCGSSRQGVPPETLPRGVDPQSLRRR